MLALFYLFLFFSCLNFLEASAVEVERVMPGHVLARCLDLESAGEFIKLKSELVPADRSQMWKVYCSGDQERIRKFLKRDIDLMRPMIPLEIQEVANNTLLLEFVEVKNLFPSVVMNLEVHKELAGLCGNDSPLVRFLAQWYMARLLKHFSVKHDDKLYKASQRLKSAAEVGFEVLVAGEISSSLKGLLYEYLEKEEDAMRCFDEGAARGEAFAYYKLAQQKEYEGDDAPALNYYEMAFILGYEKALTDIGRFQDDEIQSFLILKKAADRGSSEACSLIARMIREGFVPDDSTDEAFWLQKGVKNGSLSYSLGKLYEKSGDTETSVRVYEGLASKGDMGGLLEIGRIRENQRNFTACEKVYKSAGWFGLFAMAEITPEREAKKALKRQGADMFRTHFNDIIARSITAE